MRSNANQSDHIFCAEASRANRKSKTDVVVIVDRMIVALLIAAVEDSNLERYRRGVFRIGPSRG